MLSDSSFTHHGPCPKCSSSDGLAIYTDGHGFCFSCGHYEKSPDDTGTTPKARKVGSKELIGGEIVRLESRKLSEESCQKFSYTVGEKNGVKVQVANYRDAAGNIVAQKLRTAEKDFTWTGDPKSIVLFGQHLWKEKGKKLVITEGEIDCITVSQLQGHKWPVVSIPNGAQGAKKDLAKHLAYLDSFEEVVFLFDNDKAGKEGAIEAAQLLTPGKAKIAYLPLKDPSDMLKAGRGEEVIQAIWNAKVWRPDGIISIDDVIEAAKKPVQHGLSYPWDSLTQLTYGFRPKELIILGAGVGSGKTDVFTQLVAHITEVHKRPVGLIYLEQAPVETARRVAGKIAKKPFHVPDGGYTQEELYAALEGLRGKVELYNHFGSSEWEVIKAGIKYMALSMGIKEIFLDHLTALISHSEDERRALDAILADLAGLAQGLDITIFCISHLATPEGKSHEEGGRVEAKHFHGSRAIMRWANFMFGLERNQQAEDEVTRRTTTFRILKDRNTGRATGKTFFLLYDPATGYLDETKDAPLDEGGLKQSDGSEFAAPK